jgi:hypothetical protein
MTITQHAHINSFHTSNFNFGEFCFVFFSQYSPSPQVSSLDLHKCLENPIGLLFPTAHSTLETNNNDVSTLSQGIDKTLAIVGNQGQTISSNAHLALHVVLVIILVAITAQ